MVESEKGVKKTGQRLIAELILPGIELKWCILSGTLMKGCGSAMIWKTQLGTHSKWFVFRARFAAITLVFLLLMNSLSLGGCGKIQKAIAEKQQKAQSKEIMAKRYVEIGNYVEQYLEKKYQEDFQNGGIYDTYWTRDTAYADRASVTFTFKSNYSNVYFRPVYTGEYAHPEMEASIESGRVGDASYYSWRRGYELGTHERINIDEYFPGIKTKYWTSFNMIAPYDEQIYEVPHTIDPKYFDIDYLLGNEKDKLDLYYLNIDYFRDVYPENKDEMLTDIYDFLIYTRSLGFKRCKLDMSIFETSLLDSEEFKEYEDGEKGVELWLFMAGKNMRFVKVLIEPEQFDEVNSLEDLRELKIFDEHINDSYRSW